MYNDGQIEVYKLNIFRNGYYALAFFEHIRNISCQYLRNEEAVSRFGLGACCKGLEDLCKRQIEAKKELLEMKRRNRLCNP
jgi:hypothetical protein